MKVNDVVFVKKGTSKLIAYGRIIGDYRYDENLNDYRSIRSVEWINITEKDIKPITDTPIIASPSTTIQQPTSTTVYVKTYSNTVFEAWKKIATEDFQYGVIGRWNQSSVSVGIIGDPTDLQYDTMKYMIGDLNRLVPRIDWTYKYATNENLLTFDIYLVYKTLLP